MTTFQIGWFLTIIVGGLAGWLAGKFMGVRFGLLMNILIGVVGAVVASAIFRRFGVGVEGDWLGYLVTSFVGASILLFVVKLVRR
ncbi:MULTISPECIES: GlsB/YeaQ/YmgE family stress response membrane protein [Alphaproteobacteria]|uniref:Membrane protein n=2 Tax=Alphaproteobacteria TaxID=28211 RepID=A0A512HCT5_9HYPH|nr:MULTISPECIES: GlsB/YeaQ/YmgE family stress response membrane protein [Alphaproteobacteria]GEO83271.1 membrane protein [Ciceribacter naphthalenivorans]GLR20334.1 membrane protein [Ciceribacter naphthalenivorans]GLT03190.1 membrane protein [Sphingomonas psychrolutea]